MRMVLTSNKFPTPVHRDPYKKRFNEISEIISINSQQSHKIGFSH